MELRYKIREFLEKMIKNEGVKFENQRFKFKFSINEQDDFIKIQEIPLHESSFIGNTYVYGYEFESKIDGRIKSLFLRELKNEKSELISREDYNMFLEQVVVNLNKKINLAKFEYIVFPESKSKLVSDILNRVYDFTAPKFNTIELVKQSIENIEFDQTFKLKTKKDEEMFKKCNETNVLIIDDINTSGSTLKEILRVLNLINSENSKVIFTLLGHDNSGGFNKI